MSESTTPKFNFISLCIVNFEEKLFDGTSITRNALVKAPAYKVEIGDLVSFYTSKRIITGTVEDVVIADEFSDTYQLVDRYATIYDAIRTFSLNWEAEEGDE